jgi:double-stranded uracil-DNA glycosylase
MALSPLRDRVRPGCRVLFVGINPGIRSAQTAHHFAGFSNRFWKLLHGSGLVPEPLTYRDDDRLPEFGYGITNLVPRPTAGIGELTREEYARGAAALVRKVRRLRPAVVALVGVTVYRHLLPFLHADAMRGGRAEPAADSSPLSVLGLRRERVAGAPIFVLPNPSGRNANFSYAEMLSAFAALAAFLRDAPEPPPR